MGQTVEMDVKALFERSYPYVIGAFAAAAATHARFANITTTAPAGVDPRQVASAALNVFGLLTGLLFSVYVLAIAPGGNFLGKIFHTGTFLVFRRYVVEALVIGAIATAAVIPLMATIPSAQFWVWSPAYLAICVSAGASSLAAFFRVAHIFLLWAKISSQTDRRH